jgi:hypothetical protein
MTMPFELLGTLLQGLKTAIPVAGPEMLQMQDLPGLLVRQKIRGLQMLRLEQEWLQGVQDRRRSMMTGQVQQPRSMLLVELRRPSAIESALLQAELLFLSVVELVLLQEESTLQQLEEL